MILVIAIPRINGSDKRALAGLQHYKKLAFPVGDGTRFKTTKINFVYVTTPQNNQVLIEKALALHTHSPRRDDGTGPTYCDYCNGHPAFPCETVRILTGDS